MRTLILIPLKAELRLIQAGLSERGLSWQEVDLNVGRAYRCEQGEAYMMVAGRSDAAFREKASRFLRTFPETELIICAGSAGALSPSLNPGDVVYQGAPDFFPILGEASFQLRQGKILHHDQPVQDEKLAQELERSHQADVVVTEGGINEVLPKIEIRGVSDFANRNTPEDFDSNLERAMLHTSHCLYFVLRKTGLGSRS